MIASSELWYTTWNSDNDPNPLPIMPAPWRPAFWSMGATADFKAWSDAETQKLACVCRRGGKFSDALPKRAYDYLKYYHRDEIFPGEIIPPNTLLICDIENFVFNADALRFCKNVHSVYRNHAIYPGFVFDGSINFSWTPQLREVDLFILQRAWEAATTGSKTNAQMEQSNLLTKCVSNYVLCELYLGDPEIHTNQYITWLAGVAACRDQMPGKKIIALIQGGYAYPKPGYLTPEELQRYVRFVRLFFDGVWLWGDRRGGDPVARALMSLIKKPLTKFAGQDGWKTEPDKV